MEGFSQPLSEMEIKTSSEAFEQTIDFNDDIMEDSSHITPVFIEIDEVDEQESEKNRLSGSSSNPMGNAG